MAAAAAACAALLAAAGGRAGCAGDDDCSLNGVCGADGACACDAAWEGSDCGRLAFAPSGTRRVYPAAGANVSSWGGIPVWDADTQLWHLFASEFAKGCSLGQWSPNSQVVRATAASQFGSFERQEVVLPPFHHNPTVVRAADGTWLLYVIGRGVPDHTVVDCGGSGAAGAAALDPAPGNKESNITLYYSSSVLGPWTSAGVVLAGHDGLGWDADTTNPSAYADADGSVYLMYRGCGEKCSGGERIGLAVAPRWNCSVDAPGGCRYERRSAKRPLWGGATAEDPFIFRDRRGRWHAVLHALQPNGGFGCDNATRRGCDVGAHAFSRDGAAWTLSPTVTYTTDVTWADGTRETLNRRERPQLVFAADGATPVALTNGVQKSDVPASCSQGGTVSSPLCRSFTVATELAAA